MTRRVENDLSENIMYVLLYIRARVQRVGLNDDIVHTSPRTDGRQKMSITPSELRPILTFWRVFTITISHGFYRRRCLLSVI